MCGQPDHATFGAWVELREETARHGSRTHRLLVNRRDRVALTLTESEAELCRDIVAGNAPDDPAPDFIDELREQGFLFGGPSPVAPTTTRLASLCRFARTLDVRTERGNAVITTLHRRVLHNAFRPLAVALQILLAIAGALAVAHALLSTESLHLRVRPAQIPIVLALSLLAVAIHEMSHALVVVHHGRRIDAVGFRLHLGTPAFYVESIDALLLTRHQRMLQAAAGSWAEWLFTSTIALTLWAAPHGIAIVVLYRFVVLNTATICSNLLPFVGLDGHLLLADLVGEPNLRPSPEVLPGASSGTSPRGHRSPAGTSPLRRTTSSTAWWQRRCCCSLACSGSRFSAM